MSKYLKIILFILGIGNLIFAIGIITNVLAFESIYALNSILTVISVIGIYKYRKLFVILQSYLPQGYKHDVVLSS